MRFLAYGPIWAASALIMADAMPGFPEMPVEGQGIAGITLAILGWTIFYVLVKIFPAQIKAQKEQRDAFLKLLRDLDIVGKDKDE